MDTVFGQVDELSGIANDVFVYSKAELAHDQNIWNTLDTAWENHLKFNLDKFQLKVTETSFFGFAWAWDGLKSDDSKIKATTQNLTELQSFTGMLNYLNRFSQEIRKLTAFIWQPQHQKVFEAAKD